ncbi:MAG TPA: type II toxin-antitoxin system RelE/ParE family toxin [Terriglobales bacterium]|nr:type II toxin-antitoxin system RelE/ParE family toxin [Terriglobales bacterium]
MARLIWTQSALADLNRLRQFLALRDPVAARRAVAAIRLGIRQLEAFPKIGQAVDEMPPEFREWFIPFGHGGYLVRYHYSRDQVAILAVRHGREADG